MCSSIVLHDPTIGHLPLSAAPSPPVAGALARRAAAVLLALVALAMGHRLFALISAHAVDVLYWDQWDFWSPIFAGHGPWALFAQQHGPHRQGLGLLLSKLVADLSGWSTRAESLAIGALVGLAMLAALALKRRAIGPLAWTDVVIPLAVLTTAQHETFVGTPNPAHSAFPLLLLMLYAVAWTLAAPAARYPAVLGLNAVLTWTGFGLFAGALTPALLAVDAAQRLRRRRGEAKSALASLAVALASAVAFFVGYVWAPAVDCLLFPHPRPWEYAAFPALMLARPLGLGGGRSRPLALAVGLVLLVLALWALAFHVRRLARSEVTAVGRVCLGLDAALASRYVTLMIPAILGLYFATLAMEHRARRRALVAVMVMALIPLPLPGRPDDWCQSASFSRGKRLWTRCYLERRDVAACDRATGFPIYPRPEATGLQQKLDMLEARRLNLFRDR
jgi:hypothetical protein